MKQNHNPEEWNYNSDWQEPWDGTYQTGSTRPPKSHKGLITLLLILVILLGGLTSALGVLNIRLSRQVMQQPAPQEPGVNFANAATETICDESVEGTPCATVPQKEADLELHIEQTPQSAQNIPQEGGLSLQEIYTNSIQSVVSISCTLENRASSSGTGVVLTEDGYIVTNCHVVEGAVAVNVQFTNQQILPATIVGLDVISDLAVLRVDAQDLTAAQFGDSSVLRVGDSVAAIGDPLGVELRGTMTNGIVSAINRDITIDGRAMTLIQTNAALNSGNSGGPLINCYGQVIGINTMKIGDYMSAAGVEGLGFAIPSTTVKEIVDQLVEQGYVSGRPTLGITGMEVSSFYQMYYRLPEGLCVTELAPGSQAASSGLHTGDIILKVDDTRIRSQEDLTTFLYGCEVGQLLDVIIFRSGSEYSLKLEVEEATG